MFASQVYIAHADPALPDGWSLTRPLPDEFLGMTPNELENQRGYYLLRLDEANIDQDRVYYRYKIEKIERRARYLHELGGRWPNRSCTDDLVQLAQELKHVVPLDHFIRDQVLTTRLQRVGDRLKGPCPFPDHEDRTPSFTVYPDGGWTCFGKCGRSGDIYTLIGLVFGRERFRDRVKLLADYYGREGS